MEPGLFPLWPCANYGILKIDIGGEREVLLGRKKEEKVDEVYFFQIFNLLVGIIGFFVGLGLLLSPRTISDLEKMLDKNFTTEKIEKMLNQRRNISDALLRKPKVFAGILLIISFLLLVSSLVWFR